jgi:hypothetical protein
LQFWPQYRDLSRRGNRQGKLAGHAGKTCRAVQRFADDVGRLHTPLAVLVALQNVSYCTVGVEVLGAWAMPRYFKDEITYWREGENLFFSSRCAAQLLARLSEAILPSTATARLMRERIFRCDVRHWPRSP